MKNTLNLLFIITLLLASCDRPECQSQNPIFEQNKPQSEIYKAELAQAIKKIGPENLRYWLKKYEEKDSIETLYFYVQGDSLCAIMQMSMEHWNKMENIRKKKGVGRRGAEFSQLQYDIVQESGSTRFVYRTYGRLLD